MRASRAIWLTAAGTPAHNIESVADLFKQARERLKPDGRLVRDGAVNFDFYRF